MEDFTRAVDLKRARKEITSVTTKGFIYKQGDTDRKLMEENHIYK
jgi:hypothetical protein